MADEKLTTELTLETRADEASVEKTGDKIQNILSNKVETGVTEGLRKALTSSVAVEEGRKLIAGIMETQLKQQGKVSNGVLTVAAGFEASVARRNMRAEDRAASDEAEAKAAEEKALAKEAAEYEKLAVNQYTAWWKQALAEKEQAEKEAAERAAAIAKAQAEEDLRIRLAANKIVNSRNEEEAADYRALVSMYKDLEGKGPRAVSSEYAGMEDQTGSSQLPGALSGLINSSPALVSVYQTLRELQTTLAEKTDTPLVAAITKIAGPAVSSTINAVSKAFKGLGAAAGKVAGVFQRFANSSALSSSPTCRRCEHLSSSSAMPSLRWWLRS